MSWRDKKKVAVGGMPNDAEKRGGTPKKLEVPEQGEGRWEKTGMPKKGRDAGKKMGMSRKGRDAGKKMGKSKKREGRRKDEDAVTMEARNGKKGGAEKKEILKKREGLNKKWI